MDMCNLKFVSPGINIFKVETGWRLKNNASGNRAAPKLNLYGKKTGELNRITIGMIMLPLEIN